MTDLAELSAYTNNPVSLPMTGGCACGALRYSIDAQPLIALQCHCVYCQKLSGTGHGCFVVTPGEAATTSGEAQEFSYVADSGGTSFRYFCPQCSAMVFARLSRHPEAFVVTAASLDDRDSYRPSVTVFAKEATGWDPPAPGLTLFMEGLG